MIAGMASTGDVSAWIAVIVNAALLKPIVYGCAVGIAAAEFSGLGEGHDGFTGRFVARTVEAMIAISLYQGGLYLTGLIGVRMASSSGWPGRWSCSASSSCVSARFCSGHCSRVPWRRRPAPVRRNG